MRLWTTKTLSGNLARLPDKVLVAKEPEPSAALKAREHQSVMRID
jgi:hypothetical protein